MTRSAVLVSCAFLIAFAAAAVNAEEAFGGRLLQSSSSDSNVYCSWDGNRCALRKSFIGRLPELLNSSAITDSARAVARAAFRATVCANFTNQPDCLDAVSYNCNWNTVAQSCELADLLDLNSLNGLAYCPGSRMEAAINCTLITPDGSDACTASSYNCTVTSTSDLNLNVGDRLYDMVAGTMLGMIVKSASGADQLASGILSWLSGLVSLPDLGTKACVASWETDSSYLKSMFNDVLNAYKDNRDTLSALLSPGLLGDCDGARRFRDAVAACPQASSRPSCEALRGCGWVDVARVCSAAGDLLPSLALDASDRWVWVLNNATEACRQITDAAACTAASNLDLVLQGRVPIVLPGGDGGSGGNGSGQAGPGGGDGGASGRAGVLPGWSLLALALAAVAGVEMVRRV